MFHRILGGLSAASVLTGLAFLPPPWGTVAIVAGTIGALATNLKKSIYGDPKPSGAIPVEELTPVDRPDSKR